MQAGRVRGPWGRSSEPSRMMAGRMEWEVREGEARAARREEREGGVKTRFRAMHSRNRKVRWRAVRWSQVRCAEP